MTRTRVSRASAPDLAERVADLARGDVLAGGVDDQRHQVDVIAGRCRSRASSQSRVDTTPSTRTTSGFQP